MSYSLAVKFNNKKEKDHIIEFYGTHQNIIKEMSNAELRSTQDYESYSQLCTEETLSYSPQLKNLLGFETNSSRPYYIELLVAWLAVKSTYKDKTSSKSFFYYDNEKIFVQEENSFLLQVNDLGLQTLEQFQKIQQKYKNQMNFKFLDIPDQAEYFKKIHQLFTDLEQHWVDFNMNTTQKPKSKKIKV